MTSHLTQPKAFTLLELIVVIAIIGIITALLFPVVREARLNSWAVQSANNLHQLTIANLNYATDHETYVPADDRWNNQRWHGGRANSQLRFDPEKGYLADYLGHSRRVTACPLFTDMVSGSASFEDGSGGYGYNSSYVGGLPGGGYDASGQRIAARPAQIAHPSRTVMFTTSAYAVAGGIQEYAFAEPPFWDFGDGPTAYRPSPTVHFRFRGKAIVAWCDGHISNESLTERSAGENPHGGLAAEHQLGWMGPDENNGYWNSH